MMSEVVYDIFLKRMPTNEWLETIRWVTLVAALINTRFDNDAYTFLDTPKHGEKILVDRPHPERRVFVCDRNQN